MKQGDQFTYENRRFLVTQIDFGPASLDGQTLLSGNRTFEVEKKFPAELQVVAKS